MSDGFHVSERFPWSDGVLTLFDGFDGYPGGVERVTVVEFIDGGAEQLGYSPEGVPIGWKLTVIDDGHVFVQRARSYTIHGREFPGAPLTDTHRQELQHICEQQLRHQRTPFTFTVTASDLVHRGEVDEFIHANIPHEGCCEGECETRYGVTDHVRGVALFDDEDGGRVRVALGAITEHGQESAPFLSFERFGADGAVDDRFVLSVAEGARLGAEVGRLLQRVEVN